jgi:hypothetical protein
MPGGFHQPQVEIGLPDVCWAVQHVHSASRRSDDVPSLHRLSDVVILELIVELHRQGWNRDALWTTWHELRPKRNCPTQPGWPDQRHIFTRRARRRAVDEPPQLRSIRAGSANGHPGGRR